MSKKLTWKLANRLIAENTEEVVSADLVQDPVVTVSVVTYNHGKYIAQALDSVLEQETSFPLEIVIGDDCSSDETSDIVRAYQQTHPDKIRLLRSIKRLGEYTGNGRLNMIRNLASARGDYVALLEGDDFWCDPRKLQTQVEQLQGDNRMALVCHRVEYLLDMPTQDYEKLRSSNGKLLFPERDNRSLISWSDLFRRNEVQTCSIMFLRKEVATFPLWMLNLPIADWPLCIHAASRGAIFYDPAVRAVYRLHANSLWSSKSKEFRTARTRETLVRAFSATCKVQTELTSGRELFEIYRRVVLARRANFWNGSVNAFLFLRHVPKKSRWGFTRGIASWSRFLVEQRVAKSCLGNHKV